jgi:multiple sugar transport system ATP-binding protein
VGTIEVDNISKKFGHRVAVNKVSFEVRERELMCLLGPPGAGKSTILRIIAGLEPPDEGVIRIDGKTVNDLPPKDRDLAMMFQSYALYPNKTVYNNLAFPLKSYKVPEAEIKKRVSDVAKTLGITALLSRLPGQLSGGERQRVAMGRAIVRNPKAFLLDEPLTNLDAKLRVNMRAELKRLQRELGATTIFATPDQLEALTISDRIAIVNQGKILQDDSPNAIYDHPKDLLTGTFVGSPAMNILECSIEEKNGKMFLKTSEFRIDVSELADLIRKGSSGPEAVLGVRPEHVVLTRDPASPESIAAEVYVTESTRPEQIAHLKVGETMMEAVASFAFQCQAGQKVWITIPTTKIHIFDKQTQNAIV